MSRRCQVGSSQLAAAALQELITVGYYTLFA